MNTSLWAPWRLSYLRDLDRKATAAGRPPNPGASGSATGRAAAGSAGSGAEGGADDDFLRTVWESPSLDLENHVILRSDAGLILLNRYPYANGHLLIALGEAQPALGTYSPAQRRAFWELVDLAVALCHRTLAPQGVNIGVNEGRAAGAGVPAHLHAHVVPRWHGDTNFITVVGDVRVIPDSLERMAEQYRAALAGLGS